MKKSFAVLSTIIMILAVSYHVNAESYGGVEFPGGAASFADVLVSYDPVIINGQPTAYYSDPLQALGIPDQGSPDADTVSLGDGGSLTLKFTDNYLTGSGDSSIDLWIFEVGPDIEGAFVEISKNNTTWYDIGKVYGSIYGIDIDSFGFGINDFFSYVRLTDDTNEGAQTGNSVGADIDAVGAISSASVPIPFAICKANKQKAAGKLFSSSCKCSVKWYKNQDDNAWHVCVAKAEVKFYSSWKKAEDKAAKKELNCSTGDAGVVGDTIVFSEDTICTLIGDGLDLGDKNATKLAQSLIKAVGKLGASLLNAKSVDTKKPDDEKKQAAQDKASKKFEKSWNKAMTKAEKKSVIYNGPSMLEIEGMVDDMVEDVLDALQ